MIRIVADDSIPGIASFLDGIGELTLVPGAEIGPKDVAGADVLLVRSVTRVDERLLREGAVRFVGTATAGVDHVDVEYLHRRGIAFRHAPGANSESVVEYVLAALYCTAVMTNAPVRGRTVGIVGFGNVGSRLAPRLAAAGARVIVNDPPLEEAVGDFAPGFEKADLETLVRSSHVVTLHVPLEDGGRHPTRGLMDRAMLSALRPGAWLINTARGDVVDEAALLEHAAAGASGPVVLDVWTSEPTPNRQLLTSAFICTPHVAGYSRDAKWAATRDIAAATREYLGVPASTAAADDASLPLSPPDPTRADHEWYHTLIRQMYDVESESERFRREMLSTTNPAEAFARFRKEHMSRRSFRRYHLDACHVPRRQADVGDVLGIAVPPAS